MKGREETTDKGKPVERRGRKAMGLASRCDYDRQVAEVNKERLFGIIRLAYHKSGIFYRDSSSSLKKRPEGCYLQEHFRTVQNPSTGSGQRLRDVFHIQPPSHGRLDIL